MIGMTSGTGSLCMPVEVMVEMPRQQETKARIGPLPLANGRLKLHTALLRSIFRASPWCQIRTLSTPQLTSAYTGAGRMQTPANCLTHSI